MFVGTRIQELRKKKGISQEELASIMMVSRQAVSKWESNLSIPDIEKIIELSNYFEVSCDYLLKGIEFEKKSINRWKELYPIISSFVKFIILMYILIFFYFMRKHWNGSFMNEFLILIIISIFLYGVYLIDKKLMEIFDVQSIHYFMKNSWFYTFPLSKCIHILFYYIIYFGLNITKDIMLKIQRRDIYIILYEFIPQFPLFYVRTYAIAIVVFIYIIINLIIYLKHKKTLN